MESEWIRLRPWMWLGVAGMLALLLVARAGVAAAEPKFRDSERVIEVNILQDVQARAAADPAAAVAGGFVTGQSAFLVDTARDSTNAVWYHLASATGSDLGWVPRSAAQIVSVSLGDDIGM